MVLATSLDCRLEWLYHSRLWYNSPPTTVTAADAVLFFDWMAMAGEARRRGWLDWRKTQICIIIPAVLLPD